MAKDPAFLFYSSDFLTGTMLMSDEQVGKYIRLMCLQHQAGHLNEKDMLKICGTHDESIFSKFIKDENGLYYNERLEVEVNKRSNYSKSRSENRKKKTHEKHMFNICETYEKHMENENVNENINKIKKDNGCGKKEKKKAKKDEPEKIHFAEFVTMTNDEYEKLVVAHGKEFADQCIKKLDNYKGSNGKKYQSDYRAILSWVVDEIKKSNSTKNTPKKQPNNAYNNNQPEFDDLDRFIN